MRDFQDHVHARGHLAVGHGHELYWEDWGNPKGAPFLCQHGGPGAAFNASFKQIFDPEAHRVIFWDQRGCGQSRPFASTAHNTTDDLVRDMEALRETFRLEEMYLAGGSWGSSLSLIYAIRHPQRVKGMLLWSLYTVTPFENDWVNSAEHTVAPHFPAEWQRFIELVPKDRRGSGDSVMSYYAEQMRSSDPTVARRYALEWTLWEYVLCLHNYDPIETEKEVSEDPTTLSVALLETHYFQNSCFIPDGYIWNNLEVIRGIRTRVVQGRFDMCTPAITAWRFAEAYGPRLTLQMVNSVHLRTDPPMMVELQRQARAMTSAEVLSN